MKCFKAPAPPQIQPQTYGWPSEEGSRAYRKANVSQDLTHTHYFDERPRGLGKSTYTPSHSRHESDDWYQRKPLPNPATKRIEKPTHKRLNTASTSTNPILQTDPCYAPKPVRITRQASIGSSESTTSSGDRSYGRSSVYSQRNASSLFGEATEETVKYTVRKKGADQAKALLRYQYAPQYREVKVTVKPQNVPLEDWGFWH